MTKLTIGMTVAVALLVGFLAGGFDSRRRLRSQAAAFDAEEARFCTTVLRPLRDGKGDVAAEILESRLDGALSRFADPAPLRGDELAIRQGVIQNAAPYRAKHPRTNTPPLIHTMLTNYTQRP